jgi:glutathione-regulated potassium-efflux system ancillary protein KefG
MSTPRLQFRTRPEPSPHGRVLVLLAHPALHRSRVNRALAEAVRDLPGITLHDLYDAYPDFDIDVAHEQRLVEAHGHLVFQHPLYWYSAPALLKQWLDLVLELGWAYGPEATALRGRTWTSAVSTGGPEAAYAEGGARPSLEQLLLPFRQTALLCGMRWLPPFAVHGTNRLGEPERRAAAARYRAYLQDLLAGSGP